MRADASPRHHKPPAPSSAGALSFVSRFTTNRNIAHEMFVITMSYVFVGCGAWNDGLLGFAPSNASRIAEWVMAFLLATEIASRLVFVRERPIRFWLILVCDAASVLTIFPGLIWISFARVVRLVYAGARLVALLDKIARKRSNPIYLIALYPFLVPLCAAIVFAIERKQALSPIRNYAEALGVCLEFSLSLGNIRPTSSTAMAVCGALFVIGIVCIGVLTNALSARYVKSKT